MFKEIFKSPSSVFEHFCCPSFERADMSLDPPDTAACILNPKELVEAIQKYNVGDQIAKEEEASSEWLITYFLARFI